MHAAEDNFFTPWDLAQVRDSKWIPVLRGIHDAATPDAERLRLVRKVLRSDYRLAWYMVMAFYCAIESSRRWGKVENMLLAVSGPLRLNAIKVLQAPAAYDGASWEVAMCVLADVCKAKDAPIILADMRRQQKGPLGVHWTALIRILAWDPAGDFPGIFDACEGWINHRPRPLHVAEIRALLGLSTHPRASKVLAQIPDIHEPS